MLAVLNETTHIYSTDNTLIHIVTRSYISSDVMGGFLSKCQLFSILVFCRRFWNLIVRKKTNGDFKTMKQMHMHTMTCIRKLVNVL